MTTTSPVWYTEWNVLTLRLIVRVCNFHCFPWHLSHFILHMTVNTKPFNTKWMMSYVNGSPPHTHRSLGDLAKNYRSNTRSSPLTSAGFKKSELENITPRYKVRFCVTPPIWWDIITEHVISFTLEGWTHSCLRRWPLTQIFSPFCILMSLVANQRLHPHDFWG